MRERPVKWRMLRDILARQGYPVELLFEKQDIERWNQEIEKEKSIAKRHLRNIQATVQVSAAMGSSEYQIKDIVMEKYGVRISQESILSCLRGLI